ncbi:TRAP transporter large permease [Microbaculum marinum]|uniref:TRAP transporter large permease subunit n=1 Tax=Microbaculum marinum TaxID=1764581 RepID=A0AAW9RVR9_9HYPH
MNVEIGLYGILALCILLLVRVPIAIAMVVVSFLGIGFMIGWEPALGTLAATPYHFVASWTLSAIPMFLLMGFISYHSGITTGLFDTARSLMRWLPGNLAISSILACSGFAAVCGSSLACAAAMGRIAIPEMVAAGYRANFACGSVAAGGTIGALIPPSILMIVYCVFTETSVTQVFVGGISVGIATALGYCIVVLLVTWLRPDIVPRRAGGRDLLPIRQAIFGIWPVLALVALVFGGLFGGFFTATEAGAAGAMGAFLLAAATRRLTRKIVWDSLQETLMTCSALFIVGVGAVMFTRFLSLSGVTGFLAGMVNGADLSFTELMFLVVLIYLILGMFMEPFGAMLVTLPILMPIFAAEQISMVWFGVLAVKLLEIGMITPPVGMNVFIIRNVASDYASLMGIYAGVALFLVSDIVVVALMILSPEWVLYLPGILR